MIGSELQTTLVLFRVRSFHTISHQRLHAMPAIASHALGLLNLLLRPRARNHIPLPLLLPVVQNKILAPPNAFIVFRSIGRNFEIKLDAS